VDVGKGGTVRTLGHSSACSCTCRESMISVQCNPVRLSPLVLLICEHGAVRPVWCPLSLGASLMSTAQCAPSVQCTPVRLSLWCSFSGSTALCALYGASVPQCPFVSPLCEHGPVPVRYVRRPFCEAPR
jgi:hypothetical protein